MFALARPLVARVTRQNISRSHLARSRVDRASSIHDLSAAESDAAAPFIVVRRARDAVVPALTDIFLSLGASSVSASDADAGSAREVEIFAEDDEKFKRDARAWERTEVWASCDVVAYFETHDVAREAVRSAKEILKEDFDVEYASSKANDWVEVVKASFKVMRISETLDIVPSWVVEERAGAVNVRIEPGIAFGTGEHATTRLCLRWIERALERKGAELVVDFGCGSGVLAIAALMLGAKRAVGVDLAKQAVESSMNNAKLNGVQDRLTVFCGDGTDETTPGANGQADIVVANILIDTVLGLEELFARYVKRGGRVALSGILFGNQSDQVVKKYSKHFTDINVESDDGWACVSGIRNDVNA